MDKIVILQINSVYKIASTGRTSYELCQELEKTGEFSVFTACKNAETDPEHAIKIGNEIDYKIHAVLSRISGLPGYYSKKATNELINEIDKLRPDIVHLRNLHSNYINLPILLDYLGKNNIATVITLHDCFSFTGKCVFPSLKNCKAYKQSCGNCMQLKHGNKSWFFDRTKRMLLDKKHLFESIPRLAVIGVSNWVTNESKGSLLDCAAIRKTIYNWIDLDTFYPRDIHDKLSSLPIVLGVASHWEESKGYKDFRKIARELKNQVQVVLVGDIKKDDKIPEIYYYGVERNPEKLAELYSQATVFFNPTKIETFGKVSAEALACGTPVVAYNVAANPEVICSGCGYVVDCNDIDKAIERIKEIVYTGKKVFETRCVSYVRENFELSKNAKEYADVYKELIRRGQLNEKT